MKSDYIAKKKKIEIRCLKEATPGNLSREESQIPSTAKTNNSVSRKIMNTNIYNT